MENSIKEPLSFSPLEGIIQLLIDERVREEKLGKAIKSEPRKVPKEPENFLSGEFKSFLSNQAERHKAIISYIQKALDLAKKCKKYPEDKLKSFNEILDCNIGEFIVDVPDEEEREDEEQPLTFSITPPILKYIEDKKEILEELHALTISNGFLGSPLIDNIAPKTDMKLTKFEKSKLKLLMRQFEDCAKQYPLLQHIVMSWPFMNLMPRPPLDEFPEYAREYDLLRNRLKFNYNFLTTALFSRSLISKKTLTRHWFKPLPDIDWKKHTGTALKRFNNLAKEAGELIAKPLFDFKGTINLGNETCGKIWIRNWSPNTVTLWLNAIHLLRKTLIYYDGWDGLFDEDSDFSDEGYRKGLYNFWKSEDVFLDSALLCNTLLNKNELQPSIEKQDDSKLPPHKELAYETYLYAKATLGEGKTDREYFDFLRENGFRGDEDYQLPLSFQTWVRYVKAGRKFYQTSKNTPRHNRTSRSIVNINQI